MGVDPRQQLCRQKLGEIRIWWFERAPLAFAMKIATTGGIFFGTRNSLSGPNLESRKGFGWGIRDDFRNWLVRAT